jgi:DHA1 family bicyclomycin/chloramphenicol resistance-like MFS transporter
MTTSPPRDPPQPALIAQVLGQMAFGLLAMTLCIPSMAEWGGAFGTTQAMVQLSFSGYVAAYGVLQLVYGPLSDRFGRRRVLLAGLAVALLGTLLAAVADHIATLIVARTLQGAGTAAGMVVGRALVQDLFEGAARTRMMAGIGMTMGLCPPAGTLIGGQLHEAFGWRAPFWLTLAIGLLLATAAWRVLPRGTSAASADAPHWLSAMGRAYARLAREPGFVAHVLVVGSATATFYAFLTGGPLVFTQQGVTPGRIGLYVMLIPGAYIAGNFVTTRLAQRLGDRRMIGIGQVFSLAGVGLTLALALAGWNDPLAIALPLMLLGVGHGLLMPAALAGTVGLVPALAGAAAGVAGVTQQLLGALAGWAVGFVPQADARGLALLMLLLTSMSVVASAVLWRRSRRPSF